MTRKFDENIRIITDGDTEYLECSHCNQRLCSLEEPYKQNLIADSQPVEDANPLLINPDHYIDQPMEYREYYCPGCGRTLESELVKAEREPIDDKNLN
jgi:N-methylhydantoinase B